MPLYPVLTTIADYRNYLSGAAHQELGHGSRTDLLPTSLSNKLVLTNTKKWKDFMSTSTMFMAFKRHHHGFSSVDHHDTIGFLRGRITRVEERVQARILRLRISAIPHAGLAATRSVAHCEIHLLYSYIYVNAPSNSKSCISTNLFAFFYSSQNFPSFSHFVPCSTNLLQRMGFQAIIDKVGQQVEKKTHNKSPGGGYVCSPLSRIPNTH